MKIGTLILCLVFSWLDVSANSWLFVGPDSADWRSVLQMDIAFSAGRAHQIAIGTTEGVAINSDGLWQYVFPDLHGIFPEEEKQPRSVYFSPWVDSVVFVGVNVRYSGEPGSIGGRIIDTSWPSWGISNFIGGGYIGQSPSLGFSFSPFRAGHVYAWIIDFYKSSDNGLTWQQMQTQESYGVLFLSVDRKVDSVLYIGQKPFSQSDFGLYRSTDDGDSWEFIRSLETTAPYPAQRSSDFLANGDTLILAMNRFPYPADSTCGISVSTDRGNTWSEALPDLNVQKILRDPVRSNIIYAATEAGIYRSFDSGQNWHLLTDLVPSLNLVHIRKDPYSDTLYIAASDSGIFKAPESSLGITHREKPPITYHLRQNFPNPFNPVTSISYSLSKKSKVRIVVYDQVGRQVAVLADAIESQGAHQVKFDGSDLASGIYFYRLKINNNHAETRKMILLR